MRLLESAPKVEVEALDPRALLAALQFEYELALDVEVLEKRKTEQAQAREDFSGILKSAKRAAQRTKKRRDS